MQIFCELLSSYIISLNKMKLVLIMGFFKVGLATVTFSERWENEKFSSGVDPKCWKWTQRICCRVETRWLLTLFLCKNKVVSAGLLKCNQGAVTKIKADCSAGYYSNYCSLLKVPICGNTLYERHSWYFF